MRGQFFKMGKLFKQISYTVTSNLVSFVISALVMFIVPKILGVESYGYLQLYIFYLNYTGFLHLGWADGVFLRYGGEYYDLLNKNKFSAQFWLYAIMEIIFGSIISLLGLVIVGDPNKTIVFTMLGVSVILFLPRTLLQYILQCTNRIKEYATLIILEKLTYFLFIVIVLLLGNGHFAMIIMADLIGKTVSLSYAVYQCRDIVLYRPEPVKSALHEAKCNISVGGKLLFSNIASMLIIGFVRISIENQWDVATFGKVSLTLSVSNLLMVFIRAVALVLFPMLRRTDGEKLIDLYPKMRTCLMIPLFGFMVLYYPIKTVLAIWLPAYAESLTYMAILFPMCIFESKMSMLIEVYMKTLRKERKLLAVNIITLCLSICITWITVFRLYNLDLAIASIVGLLAFRCVLAENMLSKDIEIKIQKDIIGELLLSLIFIGANWFVGGIYGVVLYFICYLVYLKIQSEDVKFLMRGAKRILTKR